MSRVTRWTDPFAAAWLFFLACAGFLLAFITGASIASVVSP